jgi:putative transposase
MMTEGNGQVGIEVPRDRGGTFEPQIVTKRWRRLNGVDEIVLSFACEGADDRGDQDALAHALGRSGSA